MSGLLKKVFIIIITITIITIITIITVIIIIIINLNLKLFTLKRNALPSFLYATIARTYEEYTISLTNKVYM